MEILGNPITRYQYARNEAYREAEIRIQSLLAAIFPSLVPVPVQLTEIDGTALEAWSQTWRNHPDRRFDWNWSEERKAWQNALDRFEVAIWSGTVLCGLAIGKPSKGREHLSVHVLEGAPNPVHPLKSAVRFCVVEAALAYARTIGCRRLRVMRPVEGAIPLYMEMGFSLSGSPKGGSYCWLEV